MNDSECVLYTKQEVTEAFQFMLYMRDTYCGKVWDTEDKYKTLKAFNIAMDAMGRMETIE